MIENEKQSLKIILEIIREYQICNILDLYDFVDEHGEDYGLDMNTVNEVIQGKTGFMKLLFDGAYQRRKRVQKVDLEIGEVLIEENADE